jgi:hypothetical protein
MKYLDQNQKDFCYWDAKSVGDSVIILCNFVVTLMLLSVTFRYAYKSIKILNKKIMKFYLMAILWGLCKNLFIKQVS